MIERVKLSLIEEFGIHIIEEVQLEGLQPALYIPKSEIAAVCLFLRNNDAFYFDFLSNITAVDDPNTEAFYVVYHLASLPHQTQLTLKVKLPYTAIDDLLPELPSVSSVWKTAEWHEREAFDLMGVYFTDHPDLRRILMPDDWQGYPLRKSYIDPETYHEIPVK